MVTLDALGARMAPPREKAVELLAAAERTHGLVFPEELRQWIRLFERYELETIEPAFTELRAPDAATRLRTIVDIEDESRIAGVVGLFTGASIIGQQDELSYLASWAGSPEGCSKVFHFHPEDWGMWPTDPSLVITLHDLLQDDKRELRDRRFTGEEAALAVTELDALRERERTHRLDPRLDPERLFARTAWLVHLFLGHGGDWKTELADAGTIRDWHDERELVGEWPHLALYWLWSHVMLGNFTELDEVFALTATTTSALVHESRELVRALREGKDVRIGLRTGSVLETLREQLQDEAPAGALGLGAKEYRAEREKSTLAAADEEVRLRASLEALAPADPKVREALELLTYLEEGGALRAPVLEKKKGLTIEQCVDRFVSLVDHRFRPFILVKVRKSARWPDASPHATHGMILALAKVAKSFDELEQLVRAAGTANYGLRRLTELHRAWGRFDDPRATRRLAEAARGYLAEVESWEMKVPPDALLVLAERDVPEAHVLIAELLEKASFSGANAAVAIRVAEAAGKLRSKRAVPGLVRAVERELGRIDDGTRARVVHALVMAGGRDVAPALKKLVADRVTRWRGESDPDAAYVYHHKDIACWMSGLLPLEPSDPELLAKAEEMFRVFLVELGPEKKPRKDLLYAIAALLRGVGNGRVRGLRDAVEPYTRVELVEDRATVGLREMLNKLATDVCARL